MAWSRSPLPRSPGRLSIIVSAREQRARLQAQHAALANALFHATRRVTAKAIRLTWSSLMLNEAYSQPAWLGYRRRSMNLRLALHSVR